MKELNLNEFTKEVKTRRAKVTKTILANNETGRSKTRIRDTDEIEILNKITKSRWKKAMEQGKVKKITENTYEYFFD